VTHPGPLQDLLHKAHRRCVTQLAIEGLLLALAVGFGASVIVLLAGTEMLGFYWIAIAAVAGAGIGFYFLRKNTPADYAVAQKMDDRLKLADTLSTATYFADESVGMRADPTIREIQQQRAELLAPTVDVPAALPFTRPRLLYPAAALALAALGMFLFRFAVTGSFDPRASLIKNALVSLFGPPAEKATIPAQQGPGDKAGDGENDQRDVAQNNDYAGDPASEPNAQSQENQDQQQADGKNEDEPDQNADAPNMPSPQGDPTASDDQDKEGNPQNSDKSAQQNQDPSLLDKVKQAISEMMNKMKPQAGDSKVQNKKSDSSQAKQQESQSQDDSQGDDSESSNDNEKAANTQEDANKSANRQSKDQQNGAGSNEGDKAQRMAEALKAMGKISELLGKRAENVTGAVMVEVGSTKQQMKTPISQSAATHAEAGSEIHRDEVPPMYEQFVQQYFEQIRKSTPAAKPAPAKAPR